MFGKFSENPVGRAQYPSQENAAQYVNFSQLQVDLGGRCRANEQWQNRGPGDLLQSLPQFDLDWHFLPTNRLHEQTHSNAQPQHCNQPEQLRAQHPQPHSNHSDAQLQFNQDRQFTAQTDNNCAQLQFNQHGQFTATEHHSQTYNDAYAQSQLDLYGQLRVSERHPQTQCDKSQNTGHLDFDADWQFKATDYQSQWRPHKDKLPQDVAELEFDTQGRITSMSTQGHVKYEYSQFGDDGQPTNCKIIDGKTGDWGQWKQESEGIWRSYNKNHPNYEILRGRWTVDSHGRMHMQGVQDAAPLPLVSNDGVVRKPADPATHQDSIHHVYTNRPSPYLPKGYHTVTRPLPPEAVSVARTLLGGDYGTETPFNVDGRCFLARVEHHYHPQGFKGGPNGWHKGVTLYEADKPGEPKSATTKPVSDEPLFGP